MSLVGTRTFETGNTTLNAISILTPGESLPNVRSVSGLEVIIHDVAQLGRRSYVTGPDDITARWMIYLLAWSPANGATLNSAATRIMERFSKAVTIQTAPTPEGLSVLAQVLVVIPSDSVIS